MRGGVTGRGCGNTERGKRRVRILASIAALVLAAAAGSAVALDASPVYRFFNTKSGTHFYTISANERDVVLAQYPWFTLEGVAYYAYTAQESGTAPVFRFYNKSTGTHFYTISETERNTVIASYPVFIYEGPVYFAPPSSGSTDTALYRFYNTKTGAHFYTTSAAERDHVQQTWPWFAYEGTSYYVYTSATPAASSGNTAPVVKLTASNTQIGVPGTVTLTAAAADADGSVAKVAFYLGTAKLGEVAAPPYTLTYRATEAGDYTFGAVAYDDKGAATAADTVVVHAGAPPPPTPGNQLPKITLVVSTSLVTVPASVTLTATGVSDGDGTVTRVTFYMNGAKLVDLAAPPYTYAVNLTAAGTYSFTAEAADNAGGVTQTVAQNVVAGAQVPVVTASADLWRLLNQATFGASQTEAARVLALGIPGWIDDQFGKPVSGYPDTKYNKIQLTQTPDCTTKDPNGVAYPASSPQAMCVRDHLTLAMLQRDFFTNAVGGVDQLRQRVAWALSQILVTSGNESDLSYAYSMARYQSLMFKHAFDNFQTLLLDVSTSPAMGNYLDSVNNDRAAGTRVPNENYAREIMQLFSIGLAELNADGTPILDANGTPVPSYGQNEIKEFAKIFTGWTYALASNPLANATRKNPAYYASPMVPYPTTTTNGHEPGTKTLLRGTVVPANQTIQQDLAVAVQNVFMHPNTGPFIAKQLIQRLVTGNPSGGYVQRIAAMFDNNGTGVRGDLKAVVRAILLDAEARGPVKSDPTFGTLKEPVLMLTSLLRATGGVTDGNRLEGAASSLGQRPFYPPTVFNYFPPDATVPGTAILGPEFAIHTSNTAVTRANLVYTLVYNGYNADATIPNATGTKVNTQQFEALAATPAAMVDRIADVLTGGQLSAAARATIVTAVNAVAATDAPNRARMAVYLMASSYHFQVQL